MLNDYTHFHFFKGWPKFLPALYSNHHSYTHIRLFLLVWPKFRPAFPVSAHISNCFPIQHILLGSRVSTKATYAPQVKGQQRYGSLNSKQNYPQRIYVYFLFLLTWPKFWPAFPRTSKHMVLFTGQAQAGRNFGQVLQKLK